jgi:uncharacterized membrane protein YfcA
MTTPVLTWSDLPVLVFGIVGFGGALVTLTFLACLGLGCDRDVPVAGSILAIMVVSSMQLVYIRFWRSHRSATRNVTIVAYVVALSALVGFLRLV